MVNRICSKMLWRIQRIVIEHRKINKVIFDFWLLPEQQENLHYASARNNGTFRKLYKLLFGTVEPTYIVLK